MDTIALQIMCRLSKTRTWGRSAACNGFSNFNEALENLTPIINELLLAVARGGEESSSNSTSTLQLIMNRVYGEVEVEEESFRASQQTMPASTIVKLQSRGFRTHRPLGMVYHVWM